MIGNSRHTELDENYDPEVGKARGVLRGPVPAGKMKPTRRQPALDVATLVAHYWSVSWDLRGFDPHIAETIPHPNVHLVFEQGAATVSGVQTSRFSRTLEGRSSAFGIKFRPGGFRPFCGTLVSKLIDRTIDAQRFFGGDILAIASTIETSKNEKEKIKAADAFLRARLPGAADASIELASGLVDQILQDHSIRTVEALATHSGLGKRTLQCLFSEYVGVSPKWVIRRYRLHETLERLHSGTKIDCAELAVDLGYFDQAHLINDFKSIVGLTPVQYNQLATGDISASASSTRAVTSCIDASPSTRR